MVLVRTMLLLIVVGIIGLSVVATSDTMAAPATIMSEPVLQDIIDASHAENHCVLELGINHDAAGSNCCWQMNCAHSSAATLPINDFIEPLPKLSPLLIAAKQIAGRNLAPDPGPPKPVA